MNQDEYILKFISLFEDDLNEITNYIVQNLQNPEAAHKLIDDVETAIYKRLTCPLAFAPYDSSKNRLYPYYRINVRNFSIFYVVIGNTMEVRRILYAKRNLDSLLE